MGARKPSTRHLYASNGSVCERVRLISTRLLAPYVLSFPLHRLDSGSLPSTLKSMSRPLPCSSPRRAGNRSVKKDYIPHVHFRFRPGTRKWVKSSLIATIWAFNIRRFEGAIPKSLSTPLRKDRDGSPSALATKSSPSQSADAQTAVCPVSVLRFYMDRSSSFRQSIQLLGAMVGVRRAEPYRNKVCHTGLWTLSRRHIQPKVWKIPLHIRGRSTRAIVPPSVVKMYVYSRYLLGSRWSSQNTFARFYKLDVQSLASQVRSVSN